jgi:hypothetical protein
LSLTLFEKLPLKQAVAGVEPIETNPALIQPKTAMSADVSMITAEDRYCHSQEYRQGRRVEQWQRGTVARPISITSSTRLSIDWTLRSANLISTPVLLSR